MRDPSDYWTEWAARLADLGVEAKLIGALAASLYRVTPRATTDVDFLARSLDGIADALREEGFDVEAVSDEDGDPYLLFIRGEGVRIDVLLAETEYQREALDRATGPAITVEDVIIHKLLAWRTRDRDDISSILAAGHDLDEGYIERWAAAWDVADRWQEARR